MGRLLIVAGILLIVIGVAVTWGVPLGRLPGDISIKRGNFGFYLPLATSIIISLLLTLVMMFLRR